MSELDILDKIALLQSYKFILGEETNYYKIEDLTKLLNTSFTIDDLLRMYDDEININFRKINLNGKMIYHYTSDNQFPEKGELYTPMWFYLDTSKVDHGVIMKHYSNKIKIVVCEIINNPRIKIIKRREDDLDDMEKLEYIPPVLNFTGENRDKRPILYTGGKNSIIDVFTSINYNRFDQKIMKEIRDGVLKYYIERCDILFQENFVTVLNKNVIKVNNCIIRDKKELNY